MRQTVRQSVVPAATDQTAGAQDTPCPHHAKLGHVRRCLPIGLRGTGSDALDTYQMYQARALRKLHALLRPPPMVLCESVETCCGLELYLVKPHVPGVCHYRAI